MLQHSLPIDLADDVLIGSADCIGDFKYYNDLLLQAKKYNMNINSLRNKNRVYSLKHFTFLGINCSRDHFFVVKFGFDINAPEIFDNNYIYDSLRGSGRSKLIEEDNNRKSCGANF
jgi:hypothetical protein